MSNKKSLKLTFTWILILFTGLALPACGDEDNAKNPVGGPGSLEGQATDELRTDLPYLREEEKLARDVYRTLYGVWNNKVFTNIADSEQSHTDQVRDLLAALVLPDPVTDDSVGVFVDASLQALYNQLVEAGRASELDALQVGAQIEDLDIADLRTIATHTDLKEALAVYSLLECGSRNHLRSFVEQIEAAGGTFTPVHLSQADTDAILSGAREQCGQ